MKSELTIGKVLKPRGLKGELKFETYSSDPARFSCLKKLGIDNTEYAVERISVEGNVAYCVLFGVDSVEKAESLRGKLVTCDRNDLPALEEGEHYIVDMIGLAVVVNGETKGRISDILQYGSADVYGVKNGDVQALSKRSTSMAARLSLMIFYLTEWLSTIDAFNKFGALDSRIFVV